MRDRLIELIRKSGCVDTWNYHTDDFKEPDPINELADHLLANGVIVLPYKPFPMLLSEDENSSDVFCPFCDTDLSGHYYGGDYEPPKIIPCFECGTWLDGTKAITREEAEAALKGGE